jgi:short-subunit dehydrogenase
MSNALRYELHPLGISVSLIEPGVIQTPLWEKTYSETQSKLAEYSEEIHSLYGPTLRYMLDEKPFPPVKGLSVSHVSSVVLKVLNSDSPKSRYVVGNDAKLRLLMNLLPDSWMDALLRKLLRLN